MRRVGEPLRAAGRMLANLRRELVARIFGYDVFISHTRDGKDYAAALEQALTAAGRRCFLDKSDLHAGLPLRNRVADALGRSAALVIVATERARTAPWTVGEARFFRRRRPREPIVPVAFGDPESAVPWAEINHDLFDAERDHIALEVGGRGLRRLVRAAPRGRGGEGPGTLPGATVEEFIGIVDSPANLAAATPAPEVVARVVEAQRRLAVATRARRAGLAAVGVGAVLLAIAGLLTARYYRNLPTERLDAARSALTALGFRVADDRRLSYRVEWDVDKLGPLADATWRGAAGPLRTLDRYARIDGLELYYTDIADLRPLDGLATVRHLKILGSKADDLAPIAGLTALEILELDSFRGINDRDLEALRGLGRLTTLYLAGCPGLTDRATSSLAGLPIRELMLSDDPNIHNRGLLALEPLPLERLMIHRTGARVDRELVDLILGFPRLKSVNVGGLPAEGGALRRLRDLAAARGLRVDPRPGSVIRAPTAAGSGRTLPAGHGPSPVPVGPEATPGS